MLFNVWLGISSYCMKVLRNACPSDQQALIATSATNTQMPSNGALMCNQADTHESIERQQRSQHGDYAIHSLQLVASSVTQAAHRSWRSMSSRVGPVAALRHGAAAMRCAGSPVKVARKSLRAMAYCAVAKASDSVISGALPACSGKNETRLLAARVAAMTRQSGTVVVERDKC